MEGWEEELEGVTMAVFKCISCHIRNWNGVTALGVAAIGGHVPTVNLLIRVGADVNSRDNEGNSILLNCINQVKVNFCYSSLLNHNSLT